MHTRTGHCIIGRCFHQFPTCVRLVMVIEVSREFPHSRPSNLFMRTWIAHSGRNWALMAEARAHHGLIHEHPNTAAHMNV